MKINNLIMGLIGIMVCAIMIGGAFLPAVSSALVTSGDNVTYTNSGEGGYKLAESGDVLVISRTAGTDVTIATLNGVSVENFNSWANVIMSNVVYARGSPTNTLFRYYDILSDTPTNAIFVNGDGTNDITVTFTFNADSITMVITSGETTNTTVFNSLEWAYIPCPLSDATHNFISMEGTSDQIYVKYGEEPILCGSYESGEIDGIYWLHNGVTFFSTAGYEINPELSYNLVDGTTDIYTLAVDINVGNETFTPNKMLVPTVVNGHASSGAVYSMFAVLPIVAIAGLVMAGIYVFISRK